MSTSQDHRGGAGGRFRVIIHAPATADIDVLQVNGFGFGGQDACLIVTRA